MILTVTQKVSHPPVSPKKGFLGEPIAVVTASVAQVVDQASDDVPGGNRERQRILYVCPSRDGVFSEVIVHAGKPADPGVIGRKLDSTFSFVECGEPISGVRL